MEDTAFSIKSSCSDRELCFVSFDGDYFVVELRSNTISARKRVWGYTDCDFLVGMFATMANAEWGWKDKLEWASIEGEFSLTCTSDKLGHVFIDVILQEHANGGERWRIESRIQTELGQLKRITSNAKTFFGQQLCTPSPPALPSITPGVKPAMAGIWRAVMN